MTSTATDVTGLIISEYKAYRGNCRTHTEAAAMFDAVHAEARTCIDNLADMAQRALDREDIPAAQTLLGELDEHVAVRDSIEAMWR